MIYSDISELSSISAELIMLADENPGDKEKLDELWQQINIVSKSFSGSWLGYHSKVYFRDFDVPDPGSHFSQEWGLKSTYGSSGSRGDWIEYTEKEVFDHIYDGVGYFDIVPLQAQAEAVEEKFCTLKNAALTIIDDAFTEPNSDFVQTTLQGIRDNEPTTEIEYLDSIRDHGQIMTRDATAVGQGTQVPPHQKIRAEVFRIRRAYAICRSVGKDIKTLVSVLERKQKQMVSDERIGTNVFIGHGRSHLWRELKDFISDRAKLPWDEFNRLPVAGVANTVRLAEMLDSAAIAFIVLTAEDEQKDGTLHARMNVVHEAGMFQGRLGFTKAIILLEDGCEEFSNINGLGQIRFPAGNIAAVFEEIRRVLEREGLVKDQQTEG